MKEIQIILDENTRNFNLTMSGGWKVAEWEWVLSSIMPELLEEAINQFTETEAAKKLSKEELEQKIEEIKFFIAAEVTSIIINGDKSKIEIERDDKKIYSIYECKRSVRRANDGSNEV